MPEVDEQPRPPKPRLFGRFGFALLCLIAALCGATGGLLLVYTTDLPQIGDLEHYRPSSITELYDIHGRVIGSFALQRRIVVGYDDLPKVLRDALISIEDKDFERHWGINLWRSKSLSSMEITASRSTLGRSS